MRVRESRETEGESPSEWCGEASGVEECQKKKEVTTPPRLSLSFSFSSLLFYLLSFCPVLAEKKKNKRKEGDFFLKN